jgi:uncharacterized protein (DUF1697 family)
MPVDSAAPGRIAYAMPSFVALLRGVNVGKANRVPMAELRRVLEQLGCSHVATLLNSGNAVFRRDGAASAKLAAEIAAAISAQLNLTVPVVVKSAPEYAAIVQENPFASRAAAHARLVVAFTQDPKALSALTPLAGLAKPPEEFVVGKHAAYAHCPAGILESNLGTALLGRAGQSATTRNWATCLKLQQLLSVIS